MTWLVLGLAIFLGVHSVAIVAAPWRDAMVARLGEGPWKGLYSVASVAGFALIVIGYGAARADPVVLYTAPVWMRHLVLVLMLPVFPLLFAAYLPGRIKSTVRHPMLLATKLWATAHLLANGNLADVLLFGAFLAWAVADRVSLKRRTPRAVPGAPAGPLNDVIALVAGLALYGVFVVWAHGWLIGIRLIQV